MANLPGESQAKINLPTYIIILYFKGHSVLIETKKPKQNIIKMFRRVSVVSVVMVAILATAVFGAAEESWLGPELSVLQKVYDDCLDKDDFTGCLKGKAMGALNKAIEQVRMNFQSYTQ